MAAESKFGILIETQERGAQAFDHVLRQEEALRKSTDDLIRKTEEAGKVNAAFSDSLRGLSDNLARSAGPLGGVTRLISGFSLAAGLAVGAAAALGVGSIIAAQSMGEYAEKVELAAEATDLSVREIGGLTVAASNVGRTFESIQPQLALFTRRVAEARDGSEDALGTFRSLGVTLADLRNNSTGELLGQISTGLGAIGDAADRNRALFELFGRAGSSMLAILQQDMTETQRIAEKLGITLTEQQMAIAKSADVASDQFKLAWEGAINRVKLAAAPLGTTLLNWGNFFLGGANPMANALGSAYSRPKFGPTPEEAAQGLAMNRVAEEKLTAERDAAAALQEAAEAQVRAAAKLEAAVPTPWRESPLKVRTGLAETGGGGGYASERMAGGQISLGDDIFTELDFFLEKFENVEDILRRATDATGQIDEAMVGFIATLEQGGETAIEFGERMAHLTLDLAHQFGETMGSILVTVATGLGQAEDQFDRFIRALIKAAQQAASGLIQQEVGGIGGSLLGGIVSGVIGGLVPLPSAPAPSGGGVQAAMPRGGGNTYNFNISALDPLAVRDIVRRDILPEIDRSERRGVR